MTTVLLIHAAVWVILALLVFILPEEVSLLVWFVDIAATLITLAVLFITNFPMDEIMRGIVGGMSLFALTAIVVYVAKLKIAEHML